LAGQLTADRELGRPPRDATGHEVCFKKSEWGLVGSSGTTWSRVKGQTKCGSRRPASLGEASRGPWTPTQRPRRPVVVLRWRQDRKEDQEKAGPSRHHGVYPHQVSRGCCCCRGPPAPGTRQVVHATHVEDLCLGC
uniref:Uncharacterized protein n=1 Tax=Tetraodon nigroviridis TaxID=99883 RepID=H3C3T7_TETNG